MDQDQQTQRQGDDKSSPPRATDEERYRVLRDLEEWLEGPVVVLGFVWLGLLIVDLIGGLGPVLQALFFAIWGLFVLDFGLRFLLAPHKVIFLKRNWLTAVSLLVPALRILALIRAIQLLAFSQFVGGVQLVRVVGAVNRSMRALRRTMRRHGFAYAALLTLLVTLAGSAGMYFFEAPHGLFANYGDAIWWTMMIMTTMGPTRDPLTPEGRVLSILLALYAFAVFGYLTATLATYFIDREAENPESEVPSASAVEALRREITELRADLHLSREGSASSEMPPAGQPKEEKEG